jgi:Na+/proline symporter
MPVKFYSLIIFVGLFWFYCLYWAFKNQKRIITPVDFFIYERQLPGWVFIIVATGITFSGWIFFVHPGLIFMNGMPYSMTSLCVRNSLFKKTMDAFKKIWLCDSW